MSTVANLLNINSFKKNSAFRPPEEKVSDREIRVERIKQWAFKGIQASFLAITVEITTTFIGASSFFIIGGAIFIGAIASLSEKSTVQKECEYVNRRADFITCLKPKKRLYYRMIDIANTISILALGALLVVTAKASVIAATIICLITTTYLVILGIKYYTFATRKNSIA